MCTCKPHIYLPSGSPCFTVILQRPEIECQSFFALVSIEKKAPYPTQESWVTQNHLHLYSIVKRMSFSVTWHRNVFKKEK